MIALTDPPQDFTGFLIWALCIVCVALAGLAGGAIKWSLARLAAKESECKMERQEDQKSFLMALSGINSHLDAQTLVVRETHQLITEHHDAMTKAHNLETADIARLAGAAAVEKYRRENTAH